MYVGDVPRPGFARGVFRYFARHHVSLLALAVALSGTAYAATQLEPDSVGTKHIKDRAVTKKKISRKAIADLRGARGPRGLTGPQGLQGVQGAAGPEGPAGQDAPPIEALQLVSPAPPDPGGQCRRGESPASQFCGDRVTPGYGFWQNVAGYAPAGYFTDRSGLVHLQGAVQTGGGAPGPTIFILPGTHRPAATRIFGVFDAEDSNQNIRIHPNGRVVLGNEDVNGSSLLQLDGISFRP